MRTIRVFVSSPRDVGSERALANAVLERLRFEFRGIVDLQPVFWEQLPMLATDTFQSQIPRSSDADVCIFILWSWFGTPLPGGFRKANGAAYRSGTEFEFESAVAEHKAQGTPDILVYRKTAEPRASIRNREQILEQLAQRDLVQAFIDEYFHGEGGTFKAAFRIFETSAEFEEMLETHLRELVRDKLRDLGGVAEARWTTSPFRGLAAFDVADAVIFCGRTQAVTEVIEALVRQDHAGHPLVLIGGASGTGKSSLARAGVLPMLVQPRVVDGVVAWRRAVLRPSEADTPIDALAAALLRDGAVPELAAGGLDLPRLAALLYGTPAAVPPLLALSLARIGADASEAAGLDPATHRAALVVLVDQMEELFAPTVAQPQRDAFAAALAMLAGHGVWILATLRADFQPRLAELPEAFRDLVRNDGHYDLRPPRAGEVAQMIRRPAQMAGLLFERRPEADEGLDDVLRDAATADPAALPLLQFALEQLWDRRDGALLRFADFEALGGLDGAVSSRAEEVFAALPAGAQAALPRVMSALVRVDMTEDTSRVTQRRAERAALDQVAGGAALIDAFIAARLFVTDSTQDGTATVGVVHEALLRVWPRARAWIDANERALQARTRIATAEALWRHGGQSADLLLTGSSLAEAQALEESGTLMLLGGTERFVAASTRAAHGRRRTARMRAAGAVAALLAMVAAGGWYWDAYVADRITLYPLAVERQHGLWIPTRPAITAEEASHRYGYLRMTRRGRSGPVVEGAILNGSGACPLQHDIGTLLGPGEPNGKHVCRWSQTIVDGRVSQETAMDADGAPVWSFIYSDVRHSAAGFFAPDGRALALAGNGVSRVSFDRENDGVATRLRYLDAYGHPQRVMTGAYGVEQTFDSKRQMTEITYLGPDGRPAVLPGNLTGQHNIYDDQGRMIENYSHDEHGVAVFTPPTTVARVRSTYDPHDNILSISLFDAKDHPTRGTGDFAVLRYGYDDRGNRVETSIYDEHGALHRPNNGYAVVQARYDGQGRLVGETYFDERRRPLMLQGANAVAISYDDAGRRARTTYLDAAGKPVRGEDGVVTQAFGYDANGNQSGVMFLDEFDKPTLARSGIAGLETDRDEFDHVTRSVDLGLDGKPMAEANGAAETRTTYDVHGNPISRATYDAAGTPFPLNGVFRHVLSYDDAGHLVREMFQAPDGKPVTDTNGIAGYVLTLDDSGNTIESLWLDKEGRGIDLPGRCTRIVKTFDDASHPTSSSCLGAAGSLVVGPTKYARTVLAYDARGHQTLDSYYDASNQPMAGPGRYAWLKLEYDDDGNIVDVWWRDATGRTIAPNGDCGHLRLTWDHGQRTGRECVSD